MAGDWGKKIGKGLLKAGKGVADHIAEQRAVGDRRLLSELQQGLQNRITEAEAYRSAPKVAAALSTLPDNWPDLDLASTKKLAQGKQMEALKAAVDEARAAAAEAETIAKKERERLAKIARIPAIFADKSSELTLTVDEMNIFASRQNDAGSTAWHLSRLNIPGDLTFSRLVADLSDVERNLLKTWMLFHARGLLKAVDYYTLYVPVIYDSGKSRRYCPSNKPVVNADWERLKTHLDAVCMPADQAWDRMRSEVLAAEKVVEDPAIKELLHDALYGGNSWMRPGEIASSNLYAATPAMDTLLLGPLADGDGIVWDDGEGSLLTIAPPGTGKTQAHVLPNLVTYQGPMIVLDIKGECFEKTAGWRSQNVGPVFRFAPEGPSAAYNPLEFIPKGDPVETYEGAFLLASQLVVSKTTVENSYWDNQAQSLVAGLIAFVVLEEPDESRHNMGTVIDLLSPTTAILESMVKLMQASPVRPLRNLGNQLSSMHESSEKALESIFDTARPHLRVWSTGRLDPITDHSDWKPLDFRGPGKPTVYLCVPLGKVEAYASVLRVIIAQHIDALTQQGLGKPDLPIVMMLDEFPQLGSFSPAVQALEVGRSAGVKLWLITQDESQLEERYGSADAIANKCAIRLYMNPPEATAQHLAQALGFREGLLDGERRPLATPNELSGPDFRDRVLVLGRGCRPLQLQKWFAHESEVIRDRLDWDVRDWTDSVGDLPSESGNAVSDTAESPAGTSLPS